MLSAKIGQSQEGSAHKLSKHLINIKNSTIPYEDRAQPWSDRSLQRQPACGAEVKLGFGGCPAQPRFMIRFFWRSQSRSFSVLRLSCWRLPLASPISTLALPRDQYIAVGIAV